MILFNGTNADFLKSFIAMLCVISFKVQAEECIPIDRAGYVITTSGNYCVVKDIHTRLEFPDHLAPESIIEIRASDVNLDLQGNLIGRGIIIRQPGGRGVGLGSGAGGPVVRNIIIKNGIIRDNDVGVGGHFPFHRYSGKIHVAAFKKISPNVYYKEQFNIRIENIKFVACKEDLKLTYRDPNDPLPP